MNPNEVPGEGLCGRLTDEQGEEGAREVHAANGPQTGAQRSKGPSALAPSLADIYRCTCCCPESTHTQPNGHCTEPSCTDEPCTLQRDWLAEQTSY